LDQNLGVGGDVHGDDGVDADKGSITDVNGADQLGAGADKDVVAEPGHVVQAPVMRRPDGHLMEETRLTADSHP